MESIKTFETYHLEDGDIFSQTANAPLAQKIISFNCMVVNTMKNKATAFRIMFIGLEMINKNYSIETLEYFENPI